MKWLYCWKSSGETFLNETAFLFWYNALWKLGSSNCCIFEMKQYATGMETGTKIYFSFTFNLVQLRIRKTSLFWLFNLMTSLSTPSGNAVQGARLIIWGVKCHLNEQWKRLEYSQRLFTIYICINFFIKVNQLIIIPLDTDCNSNLKKWDEWNKLYTNKTK